MAKCQTNTNVKYPLKMKIILLVLVAIIPLLGIALYLITALENYRSAYDTIVSLWNPGYAAESLLAFAEGILQGQMVVSPEGPLSRAEVISPGNGYAYTRRCER